MNIAYAIWLESLKSPILKGQVIEILKEINKLSFKINIYFFAFQPAHRILLHYQEFQNIKKELNNSNIKLIIIPCLILPRIIDWFNAKWYIIPLIFIYTFPKLLFLVYYYNINILHCRSYPIMLSAVITKKVKNGIKIIFDPRSPFPEENITAHRWDASSFSYKLWKKLEKLYLKESDATIAITSTYIEHFKKISPQSFFFVIPNNVNTKKFLPNHKSHKQLRSKFCLAENEIIFVYSGSLGNHWNNPDIYARLIIKLRELDIKHKFLFLTSDKMILKETFDKYEIKDDEYINVCVDFDDVPKYLSIADFGMNLMDKKDIRMSIKTCEYLAMGLPVITNLNVLGAKEIVERYKVGLVIKDIENININEIKNIINEKESISQKARKLAIEKYSTNKVAKQYLNLYKTIYNI